MREERFVAEGARGARKKVRIQGTRQATTVTYL